MTSDIQKRIADKRTEIRTAYTALHEAHEAVRRAEAQCAVLEAQMIALATEAAELDRQERRVAVDSTPYARSVYEPGRELQSV